MELIHYLLILAVLVLAVGGFVLLQRRQESDTVAMPERPAAPTRRSGLAAALRNAWGGGLDDSTWDSFEEALLAADVGVAATTSIIEPVRSQKPETYDEALSAIGDEMKAQFKSSERSLSLEGSPAILLVVGVNGSGKTTTIAKIAHRLGEEGKSVVLGAADTFRAAAADQLVTWGDRLGVRVVRGGEGADPASVAHDALSAADSSGADVVIIDTAGRLHGKKNLMDELGKIHRVATDGGRRPAEVLLVLDATSGQNGLMQVEQFGDTVPLTGVVLTKLDGTARGGIVLAVEKDLGVPVKFVGVGEAMEDLRPFDPGDFVDDLLEI
jgi:fused signal recognition particle receptor